MQSALRLTDQTILDPQKVPGGFQSLARDVPKSRGNIDYGGLLADSFGFLTMQHSFRIASEYRTRQALKGPFWEDYAHALTVWRGFGDGDTFRVNYLGHPAMGSTSAFIFANNDAVSQATSYGQPGYGRAKWRQFLFANLYSLQFELGPVLGGVDRERRPGADRPHPDAHGRHRLVGRRGHDRREVDREAPSQPPAMGQGRRDLRDAHALARERCGPQGAVAPLARRGPIEGAVTRRASSRLGRAQFASGHRSTRLPQGESQRHRARPDGMRRAPASRQTAVN